eukprot:TRINITY_DN4532_c0_g1_i1.p1 TRINITY_DN4532_c0_g1~~TRINITY_DN4532_c0_g1_i1.p1  ORF type:complete len:227 (+),score=13.25 TRINITY_DN4532_c0_g1_i1:86-682(+)
MEEDGKRVDNVAAIKWANISSSFLTIYKRPTLEDLITLHKSGLSLVVTLQHPVKEKANAIGEICKKLGIKWINIPLQSASVTYFSKTVTKQLLISDFRTLYSEITKEKGKCLLHCQEGRHRSALFGYVLLRMSGLNKVEALNKVKEVRHKAYMGIKKERIDFAEKNLIPKLLSKKLQGFLWYFLVIYILLWFYLDILA